MSPGVVVHLSGEEIADLIQAIDIAQTAHRLYVTSLSGGNNTEGLIDVNQFDSVKQKLTAAYENSQRQEGKEEK